MQPSIPLEQDSAQLAELIAKVKRAGENELLIEHLQAAHAYLQGAMPQECAHNLEMASRALDEISSKLLGNEVKHTVAALLHDLHPAPHDHWRHRGSPETRPRRATAKGLDEFFRGADVSLGIFYPKKHVVALFPSFQAAELAQELLFASGFRMWEVIALPGYEVDAFFGELRKHHSLWADFMMHFSRLLDTEAGLVDRYRRWARRGAAFLIAYSPTQAQAEGIFNLLQPLDPIAVHWFGAGYIRHLA